MASAGCRKPRKQARKEEVRRYPINYFNVDLAEVRTAECKLYFFVAIDRTVFVSVP
jgi:hypothetical protein